MERAMPHVLVSKVLTYSDVSTDVARAGRVVLPRLQVTWSPKTWLLSFNGGSMHMRLM
jgi:hypothetical protein